MIKKINIIIDKEGKIIAFKDEIEQNKTVIKIPAKSIEEKRVSHILPENQLLRIIFKLLRKLNNEKINQWTRTWKCKWIVKIDNEIKKGFKTREDAINWEKEKIIKKLTKGE
jgi:RNA polymerase-interacting CarD/CdnL/TRCF family regulator